jgi:hypothetical protein
VTGQPPSAGAEGNQDRAATQDEWSPRGADDQWKGRGGGTRCCSVSATARAILVIGRFADAIVSLPPDGFRKREPVHLRSAITGKISSFVTIRQPHASFGLVPPILNIYVCCTRKHSSCSPKYSRCVEARIVVRAISIKNGLVCGRLKFRLTTPLFSDQGLAGFEAVNLVSAMLQILQALLQECAAEVALHHRLGPKKLINRFRSSKLRIE